MAELIASLCPHTAPPLHREVDERFSIMDNHLVTMNHPFINNNGKELADWFVEWFETPGSRHKPSRVMIAGQVCYVMLCYVTLCHVMSVYM